MEKKTTEAKSKLAGACYLFLLKEEAASLADLRSYLLANYEPLGEDENQALNLKDPHLSHLYLTAKDSDERLDVHIRTVANVISIAMLTFVPAPDHDAWDGRVFLDGCQSALAAADGSVLGSALVTFSGKETQAALSRLKQAISGPVTDISATIGGHIVHQLVAGGARHHFLIEGESATSLHDFIAAELPEIVWSVQRLEREWRFYGDRVKTILAEKQKTDSELSQMLHKQVAGALTPDAAEILEQRIGRLASMYSVLATDLHLVTEASDAMEKDLAVLSRQSAAFAKENGANFPHYHISLFGDNLKALLNHEAHLRMSLENTKAAIDIAKTQAELLRGNQGLALQEQTRELLDQNVVLQDERISLQVAAQVVELVVIFYYSLKSWEALAGLSAFERLPALGRFGVVATFSGSVVALTHFIGSSLHKKKIVFGPLLISALLVALSLAAMAILPGRGGD